MVKLVSNEVSFQNTLSQYEKIEEHPGWRGILSIKEISALLENQRPYTYVITQLEFPLYLLSYVRDDDLAIVHAQFDRRAEGQWHYLNFQDNIAPTLEEIIKKIMHWTPLMLTPTPLPK